jgi:hypothetical protein
MQVIDIETREKINYIFKQGKKHSLLKGVFIGLFIGAVFGYAWHYQATKSFKEICTFNDIQGQTVVLNDKIPAKLIEMDYEKVN